MYSIYYENLCLIFHAIEVGEGHWRRFSKQHHGGHHEHLDERGQLFQDNFVVQVRVFWGGWGGCASRV